MSRIVLSLLVCGAIVRTTEAERHVTVGRSHLCYLVEQAGSSQFPAVCVGAGWNDTTAGPFHAITAGNGFTCGLSMVDHTARCWTSPSSSLSSTSPVDISWTGGLSSPANEFLDISAGDSHVCGLRPNGTVACYGACCRVVPPSAEGYVTVSAGIGITCAVTRPQGGGRVVCWSDDERHPLLSGIPNNGEDDDGPFIDVSVGDSHACALRCNGTAVCWGDPVATRAFSSAAAAASPSGSGPRFTYITAGAGRTTCAATDAGTTVCSGAMTLAFEAAATREVACGGAGCVGAAGFSYGAASYVYANTSLSFSDDDDEVAFGAMRFKERGDSSLRWNNIQSSADGLRLVASVFDEKLYISSDGGESWRATATARRWFGLAMSADGMVIVGAAGESSRLYLSTDGGLTFSAMQEPRSWKAVACSSDCRRIFAVDQGGFDAGRLYVSPDMGQTWTTAGPDAFWETGASSADGSRLVAAADGGPLVTSWDYGATWQVRGPNRYYTTVASSADGLRLATAGVDEQGFMLYISSDGGATWSEGFLKDHTWSRLAVSYDGQTIAACESGGEIYRSIDGGASWGIIHGSRRLWNAVAMSADGLRVVAVARQQAIAVGEPRSILNVTSSFASLTSALRPPSGPSDAAWTPRLISAGLKQPVGFFSLDAPAPFHVTPVSAAGMTRATSLSLGGVASIREGAFVGTCSRDIRSIQLRDSTSVRLEPRALQGLDNLASFSARGVKLTFGRHDQPNTPGVFSLEVLPSSSHLSNLDLSGTGISRLSIGPILSDAPLTLLSDALAIDLSNNSITDIAAVSEGLSQLSSDEAMRVSISLALNGITALPAGAFSTGYDGLRKLNLSSNGLKYVSDAAFSNVGNSLLAELELFSGNSLGVRCPGGYYNRDASFRNRLDKTFAYSACSVCPSGSYCPGDGVRYECPPGRYSDAEMALSNHTCSACPAGTFNQLRGQPRIGCVACSPGYASAVEGSALQSTCKPCLAGYYAGNPGLPLCTPCSAGRWSAAVGADSVLSCEACTRGFYSVHPAAVSGSTCVKCRSGFTTAVSGASSPDDCNVDERRACPAGSGYSFESGACSPCPAGWTGTPGDLGCAPCAAGRYLPPNTSGSAEACLQCPRGRYSASLGATSIGTCGPCVYGFWPTAAARSCVGCAAGTVYSSASSSCVACDRNTSLCVGGVTAALPLAQQVLSCTIASAAAMRAISGRAPPSPGSGNGRRLTAAADASLPLIPRALTLSDVDSTDGSIARYAAVSDAAQPLSASVSAFVLSPAALVIATAVGAVVPLLLFALPAIRRAIDRLRPLDVFSSDRPVRDGAVLQKFSSPVGVGMSISYLFGMIGAAVVLVLSWVASNAVYVSTLRPLLPEYGWGAISNPLEFSLTFAADDPIACSSIRVLPSLSGSPAALAAPVAPPYASAFSYPNLNPPIASTRQPVLCSVQLLWPQLVPAGGQLFNVTLQLPSSAQSMAWAAVGLLTPSASNVELDEAAAIETGTIEPPTSSTSFGIRSARIRMSLMPLAEDNKLIPQVSNGLLIVAVASSVEERQSGEVTPSTLSEGVQVELVGEPVQQFLHISATQRTSVAQLLASAVGLLSGLGVLFRLAYMLAYAAVQRAYGSQPPPWEREAVAARIGEGQDQRRRSRTSIIHLPLTAVLKRALFGPQAGATKPTASKSAALLSAVETHVINPVAAAKDMRATAVSPHHQTQAQAPRRVALVTKSGSSLRNVDASLHDLADDSAAVNGRAAGSSPAAEVELMPPRRSAEALLFSEQEEPASAPPLPPRQHVRQSNERAAFISPLRELIPIPADEIKAFAGGEGVAAAHPPRP